MTHRKKSSLTGPRKALLAGGAVLLVALLCGGVYALHRHSENKNNTPSAQTSKSSGSGSLTRPTNSVDYGPANPSDNTVNDQRKSSSNPATTLDNGPTQTPSTKLSAQIVNATVNNGNVHVGTIVGGATSGTCTLSATQSATTVTLETLSVKQDVNTYDCGGGAVNIPTSKFHPASGTWRLKLTIASGNSQVTDSASIAL